MSDFINDLLKFNPNYDAELLEKAYEKAKELHKEQKRKSGEPYIIHPVAVAKILAELGMDDHTIVAGILHDVVEDTVYTIDDVKREFGDDIAVMVDGVTKLTNLVYSSKEEAQAENIRKMFLAMSKDIRVLVIKICDRLHNMRTIEYMTPQKIQEKCRETLEVYAPIAARLGMYRFKFELEDIAFKNLYPEEFAHIDEAMQLRNKNMSVDLEHLMSEIKQMLDQLHVKYTVKGRTKHYYSIYKKMVNQHKGIDEIFDLTAVRIIVPTVADCYTALGAIHTRWKPIPGRFKDYIAMPKSNRYQSIHTTVFSSDGTPFEIQIRTHEMNEIAEYGIAAHWKYKEGINGNQNTEEVKLSWIRQTLEWQQDMNDSKEFFETLKVDLFSGQVFVFTPKGDVIELPKGATPIDFAFKIHSRVGEKFVGAKVNGKMVPISYVLQTGEIVDVITSNTSHGPNINWLNIAKTNSAKNKIRQYLKKQNKNDGWERGKELLEKACIKKEYKVEDILKPSHILHAAKQQNFGSPEELYAAISQGGAIINKSLMLCVAAYREEEQAQLKRQEREQRRAEVLSAKRKPGKGVTVKGVDNLLIRFAQCCSPVPGDEIIGYTTKGRGVSIHRADCINMLMLPDEEQSRLIPVDWEAKTDSMTFEAGLTLICEDRKGILADISKICEDMDINLTGVKAKSDNSGYANMSIRLEISNTGDIEKVISRLKTIRSVEDIYRTSY